MKKCPKCGAELEDSVSICPKCNHKLVVTSDFVKKIEALNDTPDSSNEYSYDEIEKNKILALFSYIGLLILIPIFAAKDSKYAKYHIGQGLILLIFSLIIYVVTTIIGAVGGATAVLVGGNLGALIALPFNLIGTLLGLVPLPFMIIGIINAVTGKAKELPIIGKYKILK